MFNETHSSDNNALGEISITIVQCWHLISARPIAIQFPRNVALLRKVRGSLMCLVYFLTCYTCVFVRPYIGRRPVDWCRNWVSVLYILACCLLQRSVWLQPGGGTRDSGNYGTRIRPDLCSSDKLLKPFWDDHPLPLLWRHVVCCQGAQHNCQATAGLR